jgi:hypothetical protein
VVHGDDSRLEGVDAGALVGPVGGDLDARLHRWAAEARVDEAARRRAREWWLRRQAEEGATLAGVLADLLEAGTAVTVHTRSGRQHGGPVRALGADFVAIGAPVGVVMVALDAVTSLRTRPGEPAVVGDRPSTTPRRARCCGTWRRGWPPTGSGWCWSPPRATPWPGCCGRWVRTWLSCAAASRR